MDATIVTVMRSRNAGRVLHVSVCLQEGERQYHPIARRKTPASCLRACLHPLHVRTPAHSLPRLLFVSFSALSLMHAKSLRRLWH